MFSATVSKVAPKIQPLAVQAARQMSAISGPPTVKVSTLEQLVHGAALTVGILAIPAWVLVNIKNYRGQEE
ncbi:cytochrome c oxidase subunit 8 [Leptinotarsa decemlineata]|uniref:cytochrome c oxidase subunit 8 n=1 Tax=Leptinotarsa decemlineata TaxID=7539 RepID=UPI003D308F56